MPAGAPGFVDEVAITVSSGRGGDGTISFRRERYISRGGPDGGDGGCGGDVILKAVSHLFALADLQPGRHYRASPGHAGGGSHKSGRTGESLVIPVPMGTLVRDADRGHVLRDLAIEGTEFAVVRGGVGGKGNRHFTTSTNQAPRRATYGQDGETRDLRLELRLVADVGIVGLPNAGKSTFLARVSRARPKVADYPFTTLEPVLGQVTFPDSGGMVLADIPGLIEGAHEGTGLGDKFLRHIARTRVLLHLVDTGLGDDDGPAAAVEAWRTIREELRLSGLGLDTKPVLLALSRVDQLPDAEAVARALALASGSDPVLLSSVTGRGVDEVLGRLRRLIELGDEDEFGLPRQPGAGAGKDDGPEASKAE